MITWIQILTPLFVDDDGIKEKIGAFKPIRLCKICIFFKKGLINKKIKNPLFMKMVLFTMTNCLIMFIIKNKII